MFPVSPLQSGGVTARPIAGPEPAVGGMAFLRERGHLLPLLEFTQELLAPNTRRPYASAWRVWVDWCLARDWDPSTAPIEMILTFLTTLFHQGSACRTINVYRSAISTGHVSKVIRWASIPFCTDCFEELTYLVHRSPGMCLHGT